MSSKSVDAAIDAAAQAANLRLEALQLTEVPERIATLHHLTQLSFSRNDLDHVPDCICSLDNLVDLDVSRNKLAELPSAIGNLTSLKFLNAMNNTLTSVPSALCTLSSLYRLGLKSNALEALPANFGGLKGLVELFLTDNRLTALPDSIGECSKLVKLQASRNLLESLPESIASLPNLELMRVAVNRLSSLPTSIARAPKLAWVALSGNPLCPAAPPPTHDIPTVSLTDLETGSKLGEGASGEVFRAQWRGGTYAVKQFSADDASPDGQACDEIAVKLFVEHRGLTRVVARLEAPQALLMELVEGQPMAEKPDFASLLRCRWAPGATFPLAWARHAVADVAAALSYLHSKSIAHGDVYAHNMLAGEDGHTVLCDYGAAFFYPSSQRPIWEPIEVRAFGLFLADVVQRIDSGNSSSGPVQQLESLAARCLHLDPAQRPLFNDIEVAITAAAA